MWRKRLLRYVRRKTIPPVACDEEAILAGVDWVNSPKNADRETLRKLAVDRGHDAAAAYFMRWIQETEVAARPPRMPVREILIIPAALWEQYPEFNSDGALIISIAKRFGIPTRFVPVGTFGHVEDNARMIADVLRKSEPGVLMVTLSKGASDFRVALERFPEIDAKIAGWISVAGLFRGTFYLDRMIRSPKRSTRFWFRIVCWLHRTTFDWAGSLMAGDGSLFARTKFRETLPFPVTSIVAVPLANHFSSYLRNRGEFMVKHGPNDGMTLFADGYLPGSRILPIWGADHFFLVPGVSRTFSRALEEFLSPEAR